LNMKSTIGKVAAYLGVGAVLVACCRGSLLTFAAVAAVLGAIGGWMTGLGGVAVLLAGVAALLLYRARRRQHTCALKKVTVADD